MRRLCAVLMLGLVLAVPAIARMIAAAPISQRLVAAECVVVGKVASIEEKIVEAAQAPGSDKALYKVAVIKISDEITGANGLTSLRVGFIPPIAPVPDKKGDGPLRGPRRFPRATNLAVGQEVLLFLRKHHEKDFYVAPGFFDTVVKEGNPGFEKDVTELKKYARLLNKPEVGFKSKDPEERFQTAALLVTKYRTPQGTGPQKQEAISAEESKQILQTLVDADWRNPAQKQLSPQIVFARLNPTPEDGWKPGPFKNYEVEFPAAARKWLADNSGTYRIKKFVPDSKNK